MSAPASLSAGAQVLIGMGGNLGGEAAVAHRFGQALSALRSALAGAPLRLSPLYRTEPVGPVPDQPMFLNAVAALVLRQSFDPCALLAEILRIEASLGRDRSAGIPKGPRAIDLDLLFAGELAGDFAGPPPLALPHPGICERAFVLRPLADLMGADWPMPGIGRTAGDCLLAPHAIAQERTMRRVSSELVLLAAHEAHEVAPVLANDHGG